MHILELDDDSLFLIVSCLLDTAVDSSSRQRLSYLSFVCKRFRMVILPCLFRFVKWPCLSNDQLEYVTIPRSDGAAFPEYILRYIRRFTLSCIFEYSRETLVSMIDQMSCLSTFVFLDCNYAPSQAILDALSRAPSLASVEFCRTPLNTLTPSFSFVALENLSIKCGWKLVSVSGGAPYDTVTCKTRWNDPIDNYGNISRALSRRSAELSFSTSFIKTNLTYLERVEIEGALFPFGILPSTQWPRLRTLIFYGRPPTSQTFPLIMLLGGMPILQDLQFRWTSRLVDPHDRFVFLTEDLVSKYSVTADMVARRLPSLQSLTLSNVVPEDCIFWYLPPTLERLQLPTIIEDGQGGTGIRMVNLQTIGVGLTLAGASAIGKKISQSHCSLVELRVTLSDMPSPPLIKELGATFPDLRVLELGQAWYNAFIPELIYSEASYADALSTLRHIRELRLALPFASEGRNRRFMWFGPTSEELERALLLARILSDISTIAFQCTYAMHKKPWDDDWNEWATYGVERDQAAVPSVSWIIAGVCQA